MTKRVLRKRRRSISQPVADQIFVDDVLETSNTLLANLFDVVEASLEFPPALLLGVLRDRLRG